MFRYEYEAVDSKSSPQRPLSPGKATFKVMNCTEHTSKAGNSSLKLELQVSDCRNNKGIVFEYLSARAGWKIKSFLESIGQEQLYNAQAVLNPAHMINQFGECMLKHEANLEFGDRCVVDKFLPFPGEANQNNQQNQDLDDSIPF